MIGTEKARPSARRRQHHVLERVEEHVGPSLDQRVEKEEARVHGARRSSTRAAR